MSPNPSAPRSPPADSAFDLVIFDCDGVLIDSETISCGVVGSIMARHGIRCDVHEALALFLGRPASAVTDYFVRASKQPLPEHFVRTWRTELFEAFSRSLASVDGVRAAVESLRIPYCVASSSDEERIELGLRRTGLWDLFEGRIFSTTLVANGKPAPDLFLLAASASGVAARRCVVVEDSESGIVAAKAAGMTAYGFTGGSHFALLDRTQQLLDAGADRIVGSMCELREHFAGVEDP